MSLPSNRFCCSGKPQSESESKRKRKDKKIFGPSKRNEKAIENNGDSDSNCSRCTWNGLQRLGNGNKKKWKSEEELRPS